MGAASAGSGVVVVVDVLRFTTAVESAVGRGLRVYPYRWRDDSAATFAASVGAVLADRRDPLGPSLSPASFERQPEGTSVVLPSPNGSTCAAVAAEAGAKVLAGCLRNATAVARSVSRSSSPERATGSLAAARVLEPLAAARVLEPLAPVTVVAAGERWPDGSLRPALEDLLGAGAVLSALAEESAGRSSPEAELAMAAFRFHRDRIGTVIRDCASGRELIEKGWAADVDYAGQVDVSDVVRCWSRAPS